MTNNLDHQLQHRYSSSEHAGTLDYFSRFVDSSATELLNRLELAPGASLLDIAYGTGQLAMVAAQRGFRVTGVDTAASSLPCPTATFDVVVSAFGAMFAPVPERMAAELLRVCRPGGTIAMANWTETGFMGKVFEARAQFFPPSTMPSPLSWGDEATVRDRLGPGVIDLELTRVNYRFDYPFGPADVVDFFRTYYRPMARAFATLGERHRRKLRADLVALWTQHNQARGAGHTVIESEYLQIIGVRADVVRSDTARAA